MNIRSRASIFLYTSLFSGASFPVLLYFLRGINISELFFLVFLFNVPSALFFVLASGRKDILLSYLKNRKTLLMIGITGVLIYVPTEMLIGYAEHYVSASLATVVFRTSPLLMLLLLPTVLRERLTKAQIVALMLGFIGIYVAITSGNVSSVLSGTHGTDYAIIAMLLVAAFSYALSSVLVKRYVFDMQSSLFIYSVFMLAISGISFAASGFPLSHISIPEMALILYAGIVYNVYSFYIYFYAFRILKTTFSTNLYFLSPFITFVFAYLVLGEAIKPYYLVIGALVSIGILIQRLDVIGGTYRVRRASSGLRNSVLFDVTGAFADTGEVAIRNTLSGGGRVIALKVDGRHADAVHGFVSESGMPGIFTDRHDRIVREAEFVRGVVEAGENDLVVMKAGPSDEAERFFADLKSRINGIPEASESNGSLNNKE
jgi:drug/metabolite transporter (DMT)-like permease